MANTFTTNYGLTKSEIGANNDNWGTDLNNALSSVDTQINRKVDKADIVTQTSNKIAFAGTTITANSTTASTIFENFKAGDVISIAGSSNGANNGNHTISSKTNAYTLVTGTSFTTESEGTTLSYHLIPKFSEVDIDGGTIDGADVTVGSGKTLNVSAGTLTTSTAQKDAIVDGSTAITRSSNDLSFAGNVTLAGDLTVTGNDIKSSGGTTVATFSGANTTLAGTANNIGTVTTGTLGSAININTTGIPKLIKAVTMSQTGGDQNTSSNQMVMFNAVSFPATSGKTYIIQSTFNIFRAILSGGGNSVDGVVNTHCGTTNYLQGANQSSVYPDKLSTATVSSHVGVTITGKQERVPLSFNDVFIAGSTATHYYFHTAYTGHNSKVISYRFDPNGLTNSLATVFIFEINGVSITAHDPS